MPSHTQYNTNVEDPIIWKRCLFASYWLQGTSWQKWHESSAVHTTCGMAPTGWRGPWGWEDWGLSVQKQVLSFQPAASPSHLSTLSHVSSSLIAQVDSASPKQEYLWGLQLSQGSSSPISAWVCSGCTYLCLQWVQLPPNNHRGNCFLKEGSQGQENWPVMSREVQLWLKRGLLHSGLLYGRNKAML